MDQMIALLTILGALLISAMSPGPSFVLVARTSVALSRRHGFAAALGMGVGGVVFGGLVLMGLRPLLMEVGWLYAVLKICGGLYLVYLGFKMWRAAPQPLVMQTATDEHERGILKSFWIALATQLSNPKAAIFYGSIFAALLPAQPALWVLIALPPLVFLVETAWYAVVVLVFSAQRPRAAYLGSKAVIDRIAGGVMGLLGGRLLLDSARDA